MANLKYLQIPRKLKFLIEISGVSRVPTLREIKSIDRSLDGPVLPIECLKDGVYLHPFISALAGIFTPESRDALIALNGRLYLYDQNHAMSILRPQLAQHPTYPGRVVFDGIRRCPRNMLQDECRQIIEYWLETEIVGPRRRLEAKLWRKRALLPRQRQNPFSNANANTDRAQAKRDQH
jgi:hypothetical protein